jgi:hypothetical protein
LDAKSLKKNCLGLPLLISASGAIQCFEQPQRFAASNGRPDPARHLPRGLSLDIVNELSDL